MFITKKNPVPKNLVSFFFFELYWYHPIVSHELRKKRTIAKELFGPARMDGSEGIYLSREYELRSFRSPCLTIPYIKSTSPPNPPHLSTQLQNKCSNSKNLRDQR